MKVKEANAGLLCNFEVIDLLQSRGANQEDIASFGSIMPSECKVYDYLSQTPAGTQTRDALHKFIKQIDKFKLTKAECLQVVNMRPSSAVEIHLIVEDCEERMAADTVDHFLETVDMLPQPPEKPEEEMPQEDEEATAADENDEENEGNDEEEMEG